MYPPFRRDYTIAVKNAIRRTDTGFPTELITEGELFGARLPMVKTPPSPLMQYLKRVVEDPRLKDLPDLDLLQRFITQHDEAAFAALIRRYGRTVFSVCRSVLPCEADAGDAFQASFLVLARKAASIRKGQLLGSWLYGVAYKTALKARANAASRRSHEAKTPSRSASSPADDLSWREVQAVLHEELNRLPDVYRAPLVLCFLESRTLDEAARQLGCGKGALRGRLERARQLLGSRLTRRGLGPMALVAAWAVTGAASASCVASTVQAAATVAAGGAATAVVSDRAAALTEGVVKAMYRTKLKLLCAALMAVAVLGACVITRAQDAPARPRRERPGARWQEARRKGQAET